MAELDPYTSSDAIDATSCCTYRHADPLSYKQSAAFGPTRLMLSKIMYDLYDTPRVTYLHINSDLLKRVVLGCQTYLILTIYLNCPVTQRRRTPAHWITFLHWENNIHIASGRNGACVHMVGGIFWLRIWIPFCLFFLPLDMGACSLMVLLALLDSYDRGGVNP